MPTDQGESAPASGAIDHAHLRQLVHERVFGDADPVRVGRYTVLERVGTGAMGVVYAAYDNELDRKLAVKVLRAGGPGSRPRLLREAQALARVSDPHVVQVYEVGEHASEVFVAMELVPGISLREWLTSSPRGWEAIVAKFVEAARGLAAAHTKGVVHRDVKPENVIVGDDGRARVVDFGLAIGADTGEVAPDRDASSRLDVGITQTNTTMGTPAYMAPEQIDGSPANPSADQFSLCVAMFEALCNESPFRGDDLGSRRSSIAEGPPRWPRAVKVPPRVERAILRGLAERPAERHPSMEALLEALQPPSRARRRWALALGGLATAGALATGAWLGGAGQPANATTQSPAAEPAADGKLVLAEARNLLATDPTEAWAHLTSLPDDAWTVEAHRIAAEADALGIADTSWTVDPSVVLMRLVGDRALVVDPTTCDLSLLDADGATTWTNTGACDLEENRYLGTAWGGTMRGPATVDIADDAVLVRRNGALVWSDYDEDRVVAEDFEAFSHAALGPDGSVLLARGDILEVWPSGKTYDLREGLGRDISSPVQSRGVSLIRGGARPLARMAIEAEDEAQRIAVMDLEGGIGRAYPWEVVHAWPRDLDHAIVQRRDGSLARWEAGGDELEVLVPESLSIGPRKVAVGEAWLAAVTAYSTVTLVDLESGDRRTLSVPDVHDVAMSPDGAAIALRNNDTVTVATRRGQILRTLRASPPATSMRWTDAAHLETQSPQGARTWTIPTPPALVGHRGRTDDLVFADASHLVSLGDADRNVSLWDLQTGQRTALVDGSRDVPIHVSAAPGGRYVLVSLHGGVLLAFDLRRKEPVAIPGEPSGSARFWSQSEIVFAGAEGITAYDFESGRTRVVFPEMAGCRILDANPLGQIGTSCDGGPLRIRNRDGDVLWEDPEAVMWLGHLDPAGRFFRPLPFNDYGRGRPLVDLVAGEVRWPDGPPQVDAAFHPGREVLAHAATPGLALTDLTDLSTRALDHTQPDHVTAVAYSPDGETLAYGTEGGDIRLIPQPVPAEPDALREHVGSRVARRVTIAR